MVRGRQADCEDGSLRGETRGVRGPGTVENRRPRWLGGRDQCRRCLRYPARTRCLDGRQRDRDPARLQGFARGRQARLTPQIRVGAVEVGFTERGAGRPFLILHGGAGPQSVSGFADLLAETEHVRVITPSHPGFGGTTRPDALNSIRRLAALYVALLDQLDSPDVTVTATSIE